MSRGLSLMLALLLALGTLTVPALAENAELLPSISGGDEEVLQPSISGGDEEELQPSISGGDEEELQPPVSGGDEEVLLPPVSGGDEEVLLPPVSGGDEEVLLPPISSGDEEVLLPPISSGDEEVLQPPISGGDEVELVPPVSGGVADSLPPIISGGTAGVPPVTAPEENEPEGSEGWMVSYVKPDGFDGLFEMSLGDTAFSQLHSNLDAVGIYATAEKDGQTIPLKLTISWDFSAVNANAAGEYDAVGTISLPEGAAWAANMTGRISIRVAVTAPSNALPPLPSTIVLTGFDGIPPAEAAAIALNNADELERWFSDERMSVVGCDADGNAHALFADQWDLSAVDISVPGVYGATVQPDLEEGYALAEGVTLPTLTCWVSVQIPGTPEIDCFVAARNAFRFPWVLSGTQKEQLDAFSVWLRPDGGSWAQVTGTAAQLTAGELHLSASALTRGESYELQVDYPGGQTGILSFVYDETLLISDYSEGSRDGGGDGVQLPDVSQPAPEPDYGGNHGNGSSAPVVNLTPETILATEILPAQETPTELDQVIPEELPPRQTSPISAAVQEIAAEKPSAGSPSSAAKPQLERETADGVSLSGTRVLALVELGEPLTVEKGNAAVTLDAATLRAMGLSKEQTLALTLTMSSPCTVSLTAALDGAAVEELAHTRLRVQYTPTLENAVFWILDERGTKLTRADYEDGTLSFTVHRGGTYTISEEEPSTVSELSAVLSESGPSDEPARQSVPGLLLTGLALAAMTGALVWRRRQKR